MYEALLFLHISFAATLLGAPLGLGRNLKAALAAGAEAFQVAAKDAQVRGSVTAVSALVNFLTGVGLIVYKGGFAVVPKSYHISMGLMLIAMAVVFALLMPTIKKIAALAQSKPSDADAARKLFKRLAMSSGIVQLLWAVLLWLMING